MYCWSSHGLSDKTTIRWKINNFLLYLTYIKKQIAIGKYMHSRPPTPSELWAAADCSKLQMWLTICHGLLFFIKHGYF